MGKIIQITTKPNNDNPVIKIQWYVQPWECKLKDKDIFGVEEVFETDYIQEIEAQSLDGHCNVMTFEEYENRTEEDEEKPTFYYRAK